MRATAIAIVALSRRSVSGGLRARFDRPSRHRDSTRSGGPSCGPGGARVCRRGGASRRETRRRPPSRARRPAHRSPRMLAIAAGRCIAVDPRGSPHTARNCCSNWLVTQASTVKWPELCGRGASSLIINWPSRVTKNSTHSTPTTPSLSSTQRDISTASLATVAGTRAGAMETSRICRLCWFSMAP